MESGILTDDTIKTIIVGCADEQWNKTVLDSLHEVTDYISLHHYSTTQNAGLYEPFYGESELKKTLKHVSNLIDLYPDKIENFSPWYRFSPRDNKIKIILDEWNIWDFEDDNAYPLIYYRKIMTGKSIDVHYESPVIEKNEQIKALSISSVQRGNKICLAIVNQDMDKPFLVNILNENGSTFDIKQNIALTASSPEEICTREYNCVRKTYLDVRGNTIEIPAGSICFIES